MTEFIGRFHPLLVHLPIGFLLIAVVFIWISESNRVVRISLGLGALAAIGSVITGLLLAGNEGYQDEVQVHKWSGIALMVVSIAMSFIPERFWKVGSIAMVVLLLVTGHFGGTLTHGPMFGEKEADNLDVATLDMTNAMFYEDAVKEIFDARCVSCHGEDKQKGGLRLDNQQAIDRGGKNGKVIVPGNPGESEIVTRVNLPLDDEDHMPPKEKKQLTEQERKLISLWVASGASFTKRISESLNIEQISELIRKTDASSLPEVSPPDPAIIRKLVEANVSITQIAHGSNLLQVNFITIPNEVGTLLPDLKPIAKNVYSLKLNNAQIAMVPLGDFENLSELNLSNTQISDAVLDEIIKCESLVRLNISGTKVTSIEKLKSLAKLRYLNIYNTPIKDVNLPGVEVERGNYEVPTLKEDTTVVRPK